jgi:hypothetical protein
MLRHGRQWPDRVRAIEGRAGIGKHIANRLLAHGWYHVPDTRSCRNEEVRGAVFGVGWKLLLERPALVGAGSWRASEGSAGLDGAEPSGQCHPATVSGEGCQRVGHRRLDGGFAGVANRERRRARAEECVDCRGGVREHGGRLNGLEATVDPTVPTYEARVAAARHQLRGMLDPRTDAERRTVDWPGTWPVESLERLAAMLDRGIGLLDRIREIAFDRTLSNDDVAMGVRDAFREHAGKDFGDDA